MRALFSSLLINALLVSVASATQLDQASSCLSKFKVHFATEQVSNP